MEFVIVTKYTNIQIYNIMQNRTCCIIMPSSYILLEYKAIDMDTRSSPNTLSLIGRVTAMHS